MNVRIGQQLGSYQLIRQLGQGGFAEVYLAEHIHLKTSVAVKVLYGTLAAQDVQAFTNEAQTIAALRHPHILRVLDFGFAQNQPFLVMDYALGGTLRDRHPEGSIVAFPTLLAYITQVASALAHAHSNKIIHRDVKPENMLLDVHNNLLLSDFGIAAVAHSTASMKTIDQTGTVQYMAPEQIQGRPRPASDQYALAVVVYEWLCGELPFTGSTPIEIAMRQISEVPPSLRQKVPSLSPAVEYVLFKALAKDPGLRYPSVTAFVQALGQAVGGGQSAFFTNFDQLGPLDQPMVMHDTGKYVSSFPAETGRSTPSHQTPTRFAHVKSQQITPPAHQPPLLPTETPHTFMPSQASHKSQKGYLAIIFVLVLIIILMGTGGLFLLNSQKADANLPSPVSRLAQSSPNASGLVGTKPSDATPTSPPSPTPTPKTIQSNQQLTCAPDILHRSCVTSITVARFILDKSNNQIMMHFALKNTDRQSHSFFVSIRFKDQAGNEYRASGQAADESTWPISAQSSLGDLTSYFSFFPQSGETYTLTIEVQVSDTAAQESYIYQFSF